MTKFQKPSESSMDAAPIIISIVSLPEISETAQVKLAQASTFGDLAALLLEPGLSSTDVPTALWVLLNNLKSLPGSLASSKLPLRYQYHPPRQPPQKSSSTTRKH